MWPSYFDLDFAKTPIVIQRSWSVGKLVMHANIFHDALHGGGDLVGIRDWEASSSFGEFAQCKLPVGGDGQQNVVIFFVTIDRVYCLSRTNGRGALKLCERAHH